MYLRLTRGHFDPASYDEVVQAVPDIVTALRALPGLQDARVGIDRATGNTLSLTTFDTLEHAQFSRDRLGTSLSRLLALGWEPKAPEIFEATD
jgi:hypothetical protein